MGYRRKQFAYFYILGCGDAQQLIGRGDMIISSETSQLTRCQGALVTTKEIVRNVENLDYRFQRKE